MFDSRIVTSSAIGVFVVGFIILIFILASIGLIATILKIIALWRLFEKAGEKGWKALIPVYNLYVLTKLCWDTKYFWIFLIAALANSIIANMGADSAGRINGVYALISLCIDIYAIVYTVFLYVRMARSYGKGEGFAVGLVFLNTIFVCILAFGGSKYVGPAGVPAKTVKAAKKTKTTKAKTASKAKK